MQKAYKLHPLATSYCITSLTFIALKKTTRKKIRFCYCLLSFFLFFPFFLLCLKNFTRKLLRVCKYSTYIPNDCSAGWHLPFLACGGYELRLASYVTKLQVTFSKDAPCSAPRAWSSTSGASVQLYRAWHVHVHVYSNHTLDTERGLYRPQGV